MSVSGPRVAVLGGLLPADEYAHLLVSDPGLSAQSQNFNDSFVRALRSGGAQVVALLSTPSATRFPKGRLFIRSKRFELDGTPGAIVGFLNLPAAKHLSRLVATLRHSALLRSQRCEAVFVIGLTSPFMAVAALVRRWYHLPIVAVLTDPPNVPYQYDDRLTLLLKRIDSRIMGRLLERFDGVICLTADLAADFAPGIPALVMEGVAREPSPIGPATPSRQSWPPSVVYAGSLSATNGIEELLTAHATDPSTFRLDIYGRGGTAEMLRAHCASTPNVRYHGAIPSQALWDVYSKADIVVVPRPPGQRVTRYSFPSKLLELLASGTPVVTSRLEGIPPEYDQYVRFAETPLSTGLRTAITEVLDWTPQRRREFAVRAREFVLREKGFDAQGQRIVGFLTKLIHDPPTRRPFPMDGT